MRLTIPGTDHDVEVIAEPVTIEGTDDAFVVHPSLEVLSNIRWADLWTVTHVPTSMALARGDNIDEVIAAARAKWASKTPAEIEAAKVSAHKRLAEMLAARGAS